MQETEWDSGKGVERRGKKEKEAGSKGSRGSAGVGAWDSQVGVQVAIQVKCDALLTARRARRGATLCKKSAKKQ